MECKYKETCGHDYCNLDECPEFEGKELVNNKEDIKNILIEFENYRYKQITGMEPDKKYTEIIVSNYLNNI